MGGLQLLQRQRGRSLDAGSELWRGETDLERRRGQPGAAFFTRRSPHRLRLHRLPPALSCVHRRRRSRHPVEHRPPDRRIEEHRCDATITATTITRSIPVWTRDGRSIVYVSNRNHLYGTGGFWRIAADRPAADHGGTDDAVEIHYEETNWRARPDTSPDGSRLVFSSYLGRSWHNLWLLPAGGGDAFPLTYGDWDQTSPRWSPDGGQIAFISNRHGNTAIGLLSIPGVARPLAITERQYLGPMSRVHLVIRDDAGRPAAARISIVDSRGRFHAPADAWIHGDEGFDRGERRFEAHYFHGRGEQWIDVPAGAVSIDITHGLERRFEQRRLRLAPGETAEVSVEVDQQALRVPAAGHWISADVHVHMNYGGAYRNTPENLGAQARAEHLDIVNELLVNKEQRYPDVAYDGERQVPATPTGSLVVFGQEYHTSYWGHLGLIGLVGGVILPGYAGYPNTAASSLFPMNVDVADLAHARGALVGYAHPFDGYPEPLAKPGDTLTNELPVDVALGKIDYLEVMGFSDHRATARVWYPIVEPGIPDSSGRGHRHDGELRLAARAGRDEPRVSAGAGRSGRVHRVAGVAEARAQFRHQWTAVEPDAGCRRTRR